MKEHPLFLKEFFFSVKKEESIEGFAVFVGLSCKNVCFIQRYLVT